MPGPLRAYVKWVDRFSQAIGLVTMYLVVAMIAVLLLNAVTRNVMMVPLSWCIEAAQFILAAYYIVGGAYSLQLGDHVRMDLFYERLSPTGKAKMDVFTNFFLVFYLVCLLIGSISSATYAIEYNQRNFSMWNPSMIPIKVIMVCGIVLVLLQAISILIKDIARARGRPLAEGIG
ncbi:MAG: TRAP transporter small permease subunit [Devosia sp.]